MYRYTANAQLYPRIIPIRGNETLALTLNTYGNKQWILHSGVDYDDTTQTTTDILKVQNVDSKIKLLQNNLKKLYYMTIEQIKLI